MTDIDLNAIRAREAAAAKGPWRVDGYSIVHDDIPAFTQTVQPSWIADIDAVATEEVNFILHARQDIPDLLALVAELRRSVNALTDERVDAIRVTEKALKELTEAREVLASTGSDHIAAKYWRRMQEAKLERDSARRGWDESSDAWGIVQAHPAVESADGKLVDHVLAALDRGVKAAEERDQYAAVIDSALNAWHAGTEVLDDGSLDFTEPADVLHAIWNALAESAPDARAATLAARDAEKKAEGLDEFAKWLNGYDFGGSHEWADATASDVALMAQDRANQIRTPQQGDPHG